MFGFGESTSLRRLRDLFGDLESRVAKLEQSGPAHLASMLNASDLLTRASKRWEKAMSRAEQKREAEGGDEDDQELDELWREAHQR